MSIKPWPKLDYGILLALVLPLFAILPLLTHAGLPNTADGLAHLMRQVELNQAWQEGNFYPRWGRDLAFGHGMPIFSYAPPALYQLTQFFHLFGLPLDESMKATLGLDFLLYSLGMFLLARRLFGPGPALLAAALYVYAPYRLREAYIQGNYGQFTGLAFYPLILWAFHGLVTTHRLGYLVAAAVTLAGLLFSHNISFMLFAPLLAAYLLFLLVLTTYQPNQRANEPTPHQVSHFTFQSEASPWDAPRLIRPFSFIILAGLLGLGLAAIFWLPAFGERHEIQLEGITRGFFDFRANFISLPEFFSPPLPLDLAAINPEFPLSLGLPQIIGAGTGLAGLLWLSLQWVTHNLSPATPQRENTPPHNSPLSSFGLQPLAFFQTLFFAIFLLLYAFLALPQSQSIWEAVPLLELAEFPWRMLGPAIFCAALLGGYAWSIVEAKFLTRSPKSNFYLLIPIFLTIALNAYYLYPSQFITWGTPSPADAFAYEVTSGAIGTTSTGEFLPREARQHPQPDTLWPDYAAGRPPQKIDPATLPSDATVETLSPRAESDSFRIRTPQEFTATIRTLYWPGWQLYLNDQPIAFNVTQPTGLIQVVIPAGEHLLTLKLESTSLRTTGQWLTILAAGILVIISGVALKRRASESASRRVKSSGQRSAVSGHAQEAVLVTSQFFALTTALLVAAYLLSRPLAPLFTLQSDPNRPQPADQIFQVDFARSSDHPPQLRLVGLDNLPQALAVSPTGETELTATLYWRALQKLETNYSVFLHLDAPNGQTLATVDEVHPENIPTRNWPPGLYLRNPLPLEIPADLPPIRYDVNVGWYNRQNDERLTVLPGEATTFKLGSIWLMPPRPTLPPRPLAHFGPHLTLWQASYPTAANHQTLALYWQTDQALDQNYTIFVHLQDASGHMLGQADGVPYAGLYPLTNWQPGQIITDERPLTSLLPNPTDLTTIAIGVYNPATGERLPATNAAGQSLPANSFVLPVTP